MKTTLPQVITEEEFVMIIKATKSKERRLAFRLGYVLGLRISEVIKLQPEDVDYNRRMLFIRQAKGSKDRYVPFPKKLTKLLKHLPIKVGSRALQYAINNISEQVIGRKMKFHSLRHSAATNYLSKGMNIRQVQQLLGHSNLNTTMIYTHVNPEDIRDVMDSVWD